LSSSESTLGREIWQAKTPQGKDYYFAGEFVNQDKGEDTDEWMGAQKFHKDTDNFLVTVDAPG
jgi:hypothetical protein